MKMTESRSINRIQNRRNQDHEFMDYQNMYDLRIQAEAWFDVNLGGRVLSAYVKTEDNHHNVGASHEILVKRGYRLISLEEAAILRILGGANIGGSLSEDRFPSVSDGVCATKEAFVYVPDKGLFLTRNSPLVEEPKEIAKTYRTDYKEEYYLTDEQVEKALTDAVKISDKPERGIIPIPTKRFAECEIATWVFGGAAENYGNLLSYCGINAMPIYWTKQQHVDKPFARQVTFCDLWIPLMGEKEGYSSLSARFIPKLRGIKIQDAESWLGRLVDRIIPTDFERYLLLPKKEVEVGKNPEPGVGDQNSSGLELINRATKGLARALNELNNVQDPHPEIAELSDAFGFSSDEEGKVRTAYAELMRNLREEGK